MSHISQRGAVHAEQAIRLVIIMWLLLVLRHGVQSQAISSTCEFQLHGSTGLSEAPGDPDLFVSVRCNGPGPVALTVAPSLAPFIPNFIGINVSMC